VHPGATTNYLLGALLLPPTSLLLLALAGIWIAARRRALGLALTAAAVMLLLILSTAVVAERLVSTLEPPAATAEQLRRGQAIVILAGGRTRAAAEWGGETVSSFTLQRVRYGAFLARSTGLPVLVAGGDPERTGTAEAALMSEALRREFQVEPRWVETASDTTRQNAEFSAAVLKRDGMTRPLLVTDAFHMRRALAQFRRAGLDPVAAPTGFLARPDLQLQHFFPSAEGLRISSLALREWLAIARDRVRESVESLL
jgi:uncharacterized SAM-binding protein YcdF (DUF218 family)